jgi:hypothetical protein
MNRKIRIVLATLVATPLVFPLLLWLLSEVRYHSSGEAAFADKFATIRVGEPKARVLALLGQPMHESRAFHLGQREGYETAYRRAEASGSSYYLFWRQGGDRIYAIGFDIRDRVTLAASGGT